MRWLCVVLLVGELAACRHRDQTGSDRCLAVPAAVRGDLVASPDGSSLYWLEREAQYDFDAELTGVNRLVRYDFATRRTTTVFDDVATPIAFIGGQLLAVRRAHDDSSRLVLLAADGHTQELTPSYLDIVDVEILDAHTITFLADGNGARAVYVLGLDELKPYHLIDADTLLTASDGRVYTRTGDEVTVVDMKTRATTKVPFLKKATAQGSKLVQVDNQQVMSHDMLSHETSAAVTTPRAWKLVYQGDSVLARTPPEDDRSYAYVVADGHATALPTVLGGASILGTTRIGRETWALIGHNTTNYLGDLGTTDAETDICRLPASGEVTFPTRQVPARFTTVAPALFEALAATSPGATLQIRDDDQAPPTVFVRLEKEWGGPDFATMRKRAQDLSSRVTRLLQDREFRTEVMFADRRTAIHRWRRDRLRYRTSAGMGDALVTDPDDFDFEVSNVDNDKKDDKITCSGTLRNRTHRALTGVDIKCSGNRSHLIHIDKLDVDESRAFSQTFDVSDDGEGAYIQILVDGKPSDPRDAQYEATALAVFNVATDAYAATGLWLEHHEARDRAVDVTLTAERTFLDRDAAAQEATLRTAYERYAPLRRIYGVDPATPLRLHVDVQLSDAQFDYDGSLFQRD